MHVGTDAEVIQLLTDNKWDCGIKVDGTNLYYDGPEANCIELKFPDLPGRAAYFAWKASRLGLVIDEAQFVGALLGSLIQTLGVWRQSDGGKLKGCGKDSVRIGHCKPRGRISSEATNCST